MARDKFVKAIIALYEHKPFLNRLLLEASRTVLLVIIMCLYARYDEDDRATWPTLRLVADSLTLHRLASASRVHDLVSRLVNAGYLEQRAVPRDRRVRILTPTAKMAQDQDFPVSHYLQLDIPLPDPGYAPSMTRDPAFQLKQRLVLGDLFALGAQILAVNPIMMLFHGPRCRCDDPSQAEAVGRTAGRCRAAVCDFLFRFGRPLWRVAHPRKLLSEAEDMKFVRLTKAGGQSVELTPQLLQAFDRFIADAMSGHDLCYNLSARGDEIACRQSVTSWRAGNILKMPDRFGESLAKVPLLSRRRGLKVLAEASTVQPPTWA